MAKKPEGATPEPVKTPEPVVFSKTKVLTLRRFAARRDLLSALLKDGENYTLDQVDSIINDFMKGRN